MNHESLMQQADGLFPYLRDIRRRIHRHPELSFREKETGRLIASELEREGIPYRPVAETGLLARLDGTEPSGRPVVLRADLDALPIREKTGLPYASDNGAMHACGHDLHTASLLGALLLLHRNRARWKGTVWGLFQPGEEKAPGGASLVLGEGVFEGSDPAAFIALHVAPEIETGRFGFRSGQYMASADELKLTVRGTGGHGALPHTLTDPVVASAHLILALQQVVSRNASPLVPSVLTIGKVIADGATNVIPPEVRLEGTFRTLDEAWRGRAKERIREVVKGVCLAHGVEADLDIVDGYPCVTNDPQVTDRVRQAVTPLAGPGNIVELDRRMTSEDFGFYTRRYPSVMYRLGVGRRDGGETGALHTPFFRPDEEALRYGAVSLALSALAFLETESR